MDASAELEVAAAAVISSLRRRLALWAVRWTIGFAAIAVTLHFRPSMTWLWWAGGGVAVLSLLVLIGSNALIQRRMDTARTRIAEYEREAREAERAALEGRSDLH